MGRKSTEYSYTYWCLRIVEFVAGCFGFIGIMLFLDGVRWWTILLAIAWVLFFGTMLIADLLDDDIMPWEPLH